NRLSDCKSEKRFSTRPFSREPPASAVAALAGGSQLSVNHSLPHELMEALAELLRDRPWLSRADGPPVALDDGNDLRRGAGQEQLVGRVDVVAGERRLLHGDVRG